MKPEDIKKLGLDKAEPEYIERLDNMYTRLYGDDYVVLENGCVTSKKYAGPIPMKRTNSRLLRVKQIIDVPRKGFLATVKESMTKSGGCCGSGGTCSERPFTSHPIPFDVDMSTSKWRGEAKKPKTFERFGIIWPIFFWKGDVFLFILIFSAAVATIMTLL